MKERGILFSGKMVGEILADRKRQTRRVVKRNGEPLELHERHGLQPAYGTSPDGFDFGERGLWREVGPDYPDGPEDELRCPYGAEGDRLWVREAWRADGAGGVIFRASVEDPRCNKWKPGIHLKRAHARILLEITTLRVERAQAISEADALAEGFAPVAGAGGALYPSGRAARGPSTAREEFARYWREFNGEESWRSNPPVWVIGFEVLAKEPQS